MVRRLLERGEVLRERSATAIQAAWRAHLRRRAAQSMLAAQRRAAVKESAAVTIQVRFLIFTPDLLMDPTMSAHTLPGCMPCHGSLRVPACDLH